MQSVAATVGPNQCDPEEQFQCVQSRVCIPKAWHCDGITDCDDSSDESIDCEKVQSYQSITFSGN